MSKPNLLIILTVVLVGAFLIFRNSTDPSMQEARNSESVGTPKNILTPDVVKDRKPAQSAANRETELSSLQKFLQSKDENASWNIQTHPDGRPSHILGGRIQSNNLQDLLREVAPLMGVRSEDLRARSSDDPSPVSNSAELFQFYSRYRVYGSTVKAFSNPKTQEAYHIVSDLRPLEEVDIRINFNRTEAGELARKTLGTAEVNSINISQEPLVFGTDPRNNQLVWRVFILSEKPRYQSREILVSASSGAIVSNKSMLKH